MSLEIKSRQKLLYLISAVILLTGLGSAAFVYLNAANADNSLVNDFENTKSYIHDLELYGGTLNVLMDQFNRWFAGLWHGKALAVTIAWITIFISVVVSLIAYYLPFLRSDAPDDNRWG